ncbi:MAG TPA: aminopeptidase [Jatrophihabitantaceae bacterium]
MTDRLDRYAAILLDVGVRVQAGQLVAINAHLEHAPLARAVAEQAYRRGAEYVDIWYWDPYGKRSRIRHAPEATLAATPPWLDRRYEHLVERRGALITIEGDPAPDLLAGLDEGRAGLDRMPTLTSRIRAQMSGDIAWTIAAYPTPAWAQAVFGEPDVERLWHHLTTFLYLDADDPAAAIEARLAELRARAERLTALDLDAVRFTGPGTDLTLGLIPHAAWHISELPGPTGRNVLNLPTEEVYTTPDYRRVCGHVTSTKPLALGGTLVRDLRLTVVDGEVTEVDATSGADVVRRNQGIDAGARRFGEVALVDHSSPIGRSGVTFQTTLLDENATCHLAWGAGIPSVLEGWRSLDADQRLARGVNRSGTHVDFMVGGPDVTVTGIGRDGREVELLRHERWRVD